MSSPGHFGEYGGRFVPEALIGALNELEIAHNTAQKDPEFLAELAELHRTYTGRPSIITEAKRFAEHAGGARIILKREDLNHTGSHKINNVLGQALLAKRSGKKRVIAETGAGQHGVASATAAALMGLQCVVYMGEEDTKRQSLNVARMKLLGAEVIPVTTGSKTLKDAINEAMGDHDRISYKECMEKLAKFCWNKKAVWSNGSVFDIMIAESSFAELDIKTPWQFWSIRDCRTIYDIAGVNLKDGGHVTSHKAVEDAAHQAVCVQRAYKKLHDAGFTHLK